MRTVIVVARHGERKDYVIRDSGQNWVASAERPFDPPLTEHGLEQAAKLGRHLTQELEKLNLPPLSKIYTSPFLRCRQTAIGARDVLKNNVPVRVELGLAESLNDKWYRSWALPGSDGTWGFSEGLPSHMYNKTNLHPASTKPVQELLVDWKTDTALDLQYEMRTTIDTPYCFANPAVLETRQEQRSRMKQAVNIISECGTTTMLVSHGGPVTHLYEELTGNSWTKHGESTYCCYSIYEKKDDRWETLQVNQSNFLHEVLHGDRYVDDSST